MSDLKELIIEADDITIIQGDNVKDYNVKVISSETGNPLLNIYLNITFYNDNQSIVRTAKTNIYGVAKVPIMLSGGAWFVDVHFKGNDEYKPCVVTKEINIEKFTRLDSEITSENLVINIDNASMDGTYYTIHLKDSNGNDIIKEPVNIVVKQTGDNPQTYMDMILKTDDNGIIKIPFLSYDENVIIISQYMGCARYKSCIHSDIVTFEEVNPRSVLELRFEKVGDYNYLQYKIDDGVWEEFPVNLRHILDEPIINLEDDNRTVRQGWYYLESMNIGIYKVTFCFDGGTYDDLGSFYPFCRTFIYESYIDTRKNLDGWISLQEDARKVIYPKNLGVFKGCLYSEDLHYMWRSIADVMEIIVTPYDASFTGNDCYDELKEAEVYSFHTIPYFKKVLPNESNVVGTFLNFDYVSLDEKYEIHIVGKDENFCSEYEIIHLASGTMIGGSNISTITQNGFGYQGQTYQNIDITVSSDYASMHERVNDYYMMKILNIDTLEEFYFYSYLVDNITPSHNEFELSLGNWEMVILGKETSNYQAVYYSTTAELTTEDKYYNVNEFFYNYDNWNKYGLDDIIIEEPSISTIDSNTTIAITDEFTTSNRYSLTFEVQIDGSSLGSFMIGSTQDGSTMVGVKNGELTLIKNGAIIDTRRISSNISGNWEVERTGNTYDIYHNTELVYSTTELEHNTFGLMNGIIVINGLALRYIPSADITPSTQDYDGTVFGSNWHLELREDHLNFVDYGMLPSGAVGGGLVLLNDVPLPKDIDWDLEIGITYNNARYDRLNKLTGEIQARLYEDVSTAESTLEYSELLCSPTPVPNAKTVFTRKSDEGTLYYVKPLYQVSDELGKVMQKPQYMCNPYIQYKGGVECYTETGISLFSLENQYSPVYIGNDLVRAEFHRRSGYIVISRYDDATDSWYSANILKLSENLKLQLNEYNDDYAKVSFGGTTWEFYRGRPFIVVKHPNVDIRILKLVDRVYCETINNEQSMGFIEEHNTMMSTFAPQTSIQKFKQEMHIGENIRVDNFALYDVASNGNLIPLEHNASIYTTVIDNDNALVVDKHFSGKLALNFPSSSQYLKKPSNQFSLYIGNIDVGNETSITIKARGFDENGAIHLDNNLQYGIWESSQTFTVNSGTTEIRATFDCIDQVKYIDFVIIFNTNAQSTIIMNQLMCHDGDSEPNWNVDTSIRNANKVQITFDETYYANLYNEDSPVGLCIIRPNQNPLTLRNISASDETVLAPYMKKANEWDKPNQVFLEYLNANRQIIDIDWEEF